MQIAQSFGNSIRLRPKRRESIDHAPGPSMMRLIPTTADTPATGLNRSAESSSQVSMMTWPPAAIGVQKPTSRKAASTTDTSAIQGATRVGGVLAAAIVPAISETAAQIRKSRSPAPGHEFGKVEKSRCIEYSINPWSHGSRPPAPCHYR